jgi:hypothetical protein
MAAIKVREFDRLATGAPDPEEMAGGPVDTQPVFAGPRDPLHAHLHRMAPGGRLAWAAGQRGHLAYVWEGTVSVGGRGLEAGSMILAEHQAGAEAVAETEAALLVFHTAPAVTDRSGRAGGHVHLLPAADVPRVDRVNERSRVGAALFADSDCPTCALWLHGNDFHDPDFAVALHFHSEDEIIVVTGGDIVLGNRSYGRGTAIAIPADTVYGFHTGPEGLSFINFRPGRPSYGVAGAEQTVDERDFYTMIPAPRYDEAPALTP